MDKNEKIKTADDFNEERYNAELKEWENAEIKQEKRGEYRVKKGTVRRINKPERMWAKPDVKTAFAVEGIWQELRDIKLLLLKNAQK